MQSYGWHRGAAIGGVFDGVADEVEGEHGDADEQAGYHQPTKPPVTLP